MYCVGLVLSQGCHLALSSVIQYCSMLKFTWNNIGSKLYQGCYPALRVVIQYWSDNGISYWSDGSKFHAWTNIGVQHFTNVGSQYWSKVFVQCCPKAAIQHWVLSHSIGSMLKFSWNNIGSKLYQCWYPAVRVVIQYWSNNGIQYRSDGSKFHAWTNVDVQHFANVGILYWSNINPRKNHTWAVTSFKNRHQE